LFAHSEPSFLVIVLTPVSATVQQIPAILARWQFNGKRLISDCAAECGKLGLKTKFILTSITIAILEFVKNNITFL
jgi:hypothetical protein